MDFNNLERKTKVELFELIRRKQEEVNKLQEGVDALKAKIDSALKLMRQPMRGTTSVLLADVEDILG